MNGFIPMQTFVRREQTRAVLLMEVSPRRTTGTPTPPTLHIRFVVSDNAVLLYPFFCIVQWQLSHHTFSTTGHKVQGIYHGEDDPAAGKISQMRSMQMPLYQVLLIRSCTLSSPPNYLSTVQGPRKKFHLEGCGFQKGWHCFDKESKVSLWFSFNLIHSNCESTCGSIAAIPSAYTQ